IKNNYDKYIGEKDLYNEFYSLSQKKDFKFAFAESCTGGYLSSRFVFIPGVSSNYLGSMVVYNEKLKKNILGVKEETINTKTVYSNECVREMTLGLEKITNAQVLASVSGMAGDIYKKEKKEDGVVFFCFKIYDKILIEKKFFLYERKKFIETASNYIVFKLLKEINTLEEGTA
ncbi:MAG TPA: CinA family protein, partial [Tepiditoga sp.]|nr:CinA family protein [Tepiditoga sp.]